ncbi:UDP-N-acetylmuramoyl-L-alanine--D-glutamate ligase [Phosphitispora sp. TUW77]|uniref:UDP-N-acetylmuramoyl-L-alanine--D-glutamate ligase n=1 Tax=Phosphitispora sp. TUW77 TaxID=3152361 RepID=UPI003AB3C7F3
MRAGRMRRKWDISEWENIKVLVVGMARSGIAAAAFLAGKGAGVVLTDKKTREELNDILDQVPETVEIIAGEYPEFGAGDYDFLVVSPGVPLNIPPLERAFDLGIPIYGELELAYWFAASPIVAVTGTNGKTTTTSLAGEIFRKAGRRVCVGGNIGLPLVLEVDKYGFKDIIVAEVSSFQLECIKEFRPKVAVILNFTPDHLDRHGTMENYTAAKARIYENQDVTDYTVLNYDDPGVAALSEQTSGKVIFFSRRHKLKEGIFVEDGQIMAAFGENAEPVCLVKEVFIRGAHNLENALAATAAAYVMGVPAKVIGMTLKSFQGVAHRLEPVAEFDGIRFINDSKGTNPDASIKALEAYDEPIVLLAGGRNKGSDFSEFARRVKENVRSLIVFGECSEELCQAVSETGFTQILEAKSFDDAVRMAAAEARAGEIVLLSPACASWDMFRNFEERGERFKEIVLSLRR